MQSSDPNPPGLVTYMYLSGATFTTLGFGDVTPRAPLGRILTIVEAAIGFGLLALVISYLPVLYQAFSHREATISMLDARAGSPPTAGQLLLRSAHTGSLDALDSLLHDWEWWSAELLESHLSFPVLTFYRSQHDNQSWLAAITAIMDACALVIACLKDVSPAQAQMTFAMGRHAIVDLALVFSTSPRPLEQDRLPPETLERLREKLQAAGLAMREGPAPEAKLAGLRQTYEPFVNALSRYFLFALPPVVPAAATVDNWQTSAWMRRLPGIRNLGYTEDDHFA